MIYSIVEMDGSLRPKIEDSMHESHRLTNLVDSQSHTSAPMLLKNYSTSISSSSPPTHYLWPAIVTNSQVSIIPPHSPLSDGSSNSTGISLKKKKRKANPIPVESKDEAYVS